jgi:hypothetical protein
VILGVDALGGAHELLVVELGGDVDVGLVVGDSPAHLRVLPGRAGNGLAERGQRRRPLADHAIELDLARFEQIGTNGNTVGSRQAR